MNGPAPKLVGSDNGDEHGALQGDGVPLLIPAALGLLAAALLVWRGDPDERRGVGTAALVGAAAVAIPLLGAAFGKDYFDGRNLLPAFVPLLIVIGAGFGVRRAGRVGLTAAAAFCLGSLFFTLQIDRLPRLQREDLRNAAAVVGPLGPGKVVVTDRFTANQPLRYYLGAEFADQDAAAAAGDRSGRLGRRSPPGRPPVAEHVPPRRFAPGLLRLHPDPPPRLPARPGAASPAREWGTRR